jgi:uncharacterized protein YdaT
MPWTTERFPPAMRRLPRDVRVKAIEIANAMLAEGCDEGQAIRMAIAAARKWTSGARRAPVADRGGAAAPPARGAGAGRAPGTER